MGKPRLLVVDDKLNFHTLFRRMVGSELELFTAADGVEALKLLAREPIDVVVCDVKMPGMDGLSLLKQFKTLYPDVQVILMTAFAAVPDAVEALKAGAHHYLTKPFDPDDAMDAIRMALGQKQKAGAVANEPRRRLVAASATMRAVVERVEQAAATSAPVLITGERGTGKELIAEELHRRSPRASGAFVVLDGSGLSESLDETKLIGIVRSAAGGTLFLDAITELPLALQLPLVRVLQPRAEEPVDVRIVAATTMDAAEAVASGRLREDLYYRLNVVGIHVPPLRDRQDDIAPLAFELRPRELRFSEEALAALMAYSWPGNVRQLGNAIAHAAAATRGDEIKREALPEEIVSAVTAEPEVDLAALSYREVLALSRDRMTRDYLIALLKAVKGNVTQAAERAGVERESVHRLLKRYGLRADDYRSK